MEEVAGEKSSMREERLYFVYILRCSDGSYYTGVTSNPEARIWAHQQGLIAGYTEKRRPVKLVHAEATNDIGGAIEREKQIKRWSRKKKEALFRADEQELRRLSKHTFRRHYDWRYQTNKKPLSP